MTEGKRMRVYVVEVRRSTRGVQVLVSRSHPGLVRRLFELEVPEIFDGTVEIRGIAREAGSRTKIAVYSSDPEIDPIGACVGPARGARGGDYKGARRREAGHSRVQRNARDLHFQRPGPAQVISVTMLGDGKSCRVIVPESQLSLAIGREGQNARLAAKLTGCKIDIKSDASPD